MQCSEFEAVVHDLNRAGVLDLATREAATEHAQTCARCMALREAADSLTADLYTLAMAEQQHEAPTRVVAALRNAYRAKYAGRARLRPAMIWTWGLAGAAAMAMAMLLLLGRKTGLQDAPQAIAHRVEQVAQPAAREAEKPVPEASQPATAASKMQAASTAEGSGFVALPYSLPLGDNDDSVIVRVRMPRGALGAFGLPVNEETAAEMIQVDFLLAEDGSPEAVRISR